VTLSPGNNIPKISIIVLAKNCEKYLLECIGSIIGVTSLQIVIVDPGSTDGTGRIVDTVRELYPQVITVVRKEDKSPAEGLNNGLNEVTGDVIGILNGDDVYLPGCLKFVQNHFQNHRATQILLMGGLVANESLQRAKLVYPSKVSLKRLAVSSFGSITFFHQGMFVSSEFAEDTNYNPDNKVSWDFEYLAQLLRKNPIVVRSNKHGAIFRIHPDSISGGRSRITEAVARNRKIAHEILGRELNLFDKLTGIYFRLEKYLGSAISSLKDTIFLRNRI
jgi:glycosyltransferase involved in cell wall biosynthesis